MPVTALRDAIRVERAPAADTRGSASVAAREDDGVLAAVGRGHAARALEEGVAARSVHDAACRARERDPEPRARPRPERRVPELPRREPEPLVGVDERAAAARIRARE